MPTVYCKYETPLFLSFNGWVEISHSGTSINHYIPLPTALFRAILQTIVCGFLCGSTPLISKISRFDAWPYAVSDGTFCEVAESFVCSEKLALGFIS